MSVFRKKQHGLLFDDGLSATDAGSHAATRAMFFTNGSGDDIVDAVAESLGVWNADDTESESELLSGNPLDLLVRIEDEEDEDAL